MRFIASIVLVSALAAGSAAATAMGCHNDVSFFGLHRAMTEQNTSGPGMQNRKASIKETGEELSPAEWERFDAAVAEVKAERERHRHDNVDETTSREGPQAVA